MLHCGVDAGGGCVESSIGSLCLGAVYGMSVCWLTAASSIAGKLASNVRKGGDPRCVKWLYGLTLEDIRRQCCTITVQETNWDAQREKSKHGHITA